MPDEKDSKQQMLEDSFCSMPEATDKEAEGSRVKIAYLPAQELLRILNFPRNDPKSEYVDILVRHHPDIPKDAKVTNIWVDHVRNCIGMLVEHSSFPYVPEGEIPGDLLPPMQLSFSTHRIYVDSCP